MAEKIHLLLIVCVILCQDIIGTVSGDNNEKSSDILIRNKRVLNHQQDGDTPESILDFPYVVNIKKNNRNHCVGSILSHHTVITAPSCVKLNINIYTVLSGSELSSEGKPHSVIGKKEHFGGHPNRVVDGVALITVNPPFVYSVNTHNIKLHEGLLLPGTRATISGWGYACGNRFGTSHPARLRAINVPIMKHRDCVNSYLNVMQIFDSDICTFHLQKYCGHTDPGAPLVINYKLAGVHLWSGQIVDNEKPDVFAIVQHSDYAQWILNNIIYNY